ncbi:MAG: prolipoprotein diacylglyceryl transferase [Terriglobia bacterium]
MFPRIFSLGDYFTLHTYGLLVALALLTGIYVAGRFGARIGLDRERVWNLGVYMALAGLVGAKLVLLVTEWEYYSQHLREVFSLNMLQSGGVWYGGLLAAIAVAMAYTWRQGWAFASTADVYAPGISLGHVLGRLGCFSAGCCYGKAAEVPWAVTFTDSYSAQIVGVPLNTALHPTQLYEALAEVLIFSALVWLWRRRRFSGQIFAAYIVLYATARFFIEFFRGDPRGDFYFQGALSSPQLLSLALFAVGLAFLFYQRRRQQAPADAR